MIKKFKILAIIILAAVCFSSSAFAMELTETTYKSTSNKNNFKNDELKNIYDEIINKKILLYHYCSLPEGHFNKHLQSEFDKIIKLAAELHDSIKTHAKESTKYQYDKVFIKNLCDFNDQINKLQLKHDQMVEKCNNRCPACCFK